MALPTGRGDQRMSSCGRAKKWDETGKLLVMRGDDGDAASVIGVLLSKHSTGCGGVIVNGREHRAGEKACQSKSLDGHPREKEAEIHPWRVAEMSTRQKLSAHGGYTVLT